MTPREWMDKIDAIPRDASAEEQTQQFDVVFGELLDAWPAAQLTDEEYEIDFEVLRQYAMRSPREIAEFLLSVGEYRALWLVPLCAAYSLRGVGGVKANSHMMQHYRRFYDGWGKALVRAAKAQP